MANLFNLGTFVMYLLVVLGIGVWRYRNTDEVLDFWAHGKDLAHCLRQG